MSAKPSNLSDREEFGRVVLSGALAAAALDIIVRGAAGDLGISQRLALGLARLNALLGAFAKECLISTIGEPGFVQSRFTLPLSNLIYHWMASERQSIATWCGGTEIRVASSLSHAIRRAVGKLLGFLVVVARAVPAGSGAPAPIGSKRVRQGSELILHICRYQKKILMAEPLVRKGMPPVRLCREEFERRYRDRFRDPVFRHSAVSLTRS